jgi:hypothetical protein
MHTDRNESTRLRVVLRLVALDVDARPAEAPVRGAPKGQHGAVVCERERVVLSRRKRLHAAPFSRAENDTSARLNQLQAQCAARGGAPSSTGTRRGE